MVRLDWTCVFYAFIVKLKPLFLPHLVDTLHQPCFWLLFQSEKKIPPLCVIITINAYQCQYSTDQFTSTKCALIETKYWFAHRLTHQLSFSTHVNSTDLSYHRLLPTNTNRTTVYVQTFTYPTILTFPVLLLPSRSSRLYMHSKVPYTIRTIKQLYRPSKQTTSKHLPNQPMPTQRTQHIQPALSCQTSYYPSSEDIYIHCKIQFNLSNFKNKFFISVIVNLIKNNSNQIFTKLNVTTFGVLMVPLSMMLLLIKYWCT